MAIWLVFEPLLHLLVKMIYIIDYQCFALYASNLNA